MPADGPFVPPTTQPLMFSCNVCAAGERAIRFGVDALHPCVLVQFQTPPSEAASRTAYAQTCSRLFLWCFNENVGVEVWA